MNHRGKMFLLFLTLLCHSLMLLSWHGFKNINKFDKKDLTHSRTKIKNIPGSGKTKFENKITINL